MEVKELLKNLTLEEKCALLSGKNEWMSRDIQRLGVNSVRFSDGPHGLRRQGDSGDHLGLGGSLPATCFPTAATVASSWDEELGEKVGVGLGQEANAQGVNVLLGPGLNMKRSALCGRNFEYFAEDPYLAGKIAASYIRGIQSKGVYACPKHFAVNSREYRRMAMNSVVDERAFREIYLTAFEIAVVEGKAGAIMTAYNSINGSYANENKHLLMDILRGEWGFNGIVVTDWGGSNDHIEGVKCMSTVEMPAPGLDSARQLIAGVEAGRLTVEEIDRAITPLLEAVIYFSKQAQEKDILKDEHHALAQEAAEKSAVLLKNENNILPLKKDAKIAIIGDFAFRPRYQGAGSSIVNSTKVETIVDMVKNYDLQVIGMERGYARTGKKEKPADAQAAIDLAKKADIVLYFFGLDEISETEGADRLHMRIPAVQSDLLAKLYAVNPNVVGVLSAGSAVETSWIGHTKALLNTLLTGQAGASATLNLLTGKANPSGKLAESWPKTFGDSPVANYSGTATTNLQYRESLYIGYRYYEKANIDLAFPFGYGLSYTSFQYSDISVDKNGVTFSIKNIGEADGAEVSQLYVGLKSSGVFRPVKELKGFKKTFLKAGEEKKVTIPFDNKTFRYFNTKTNKWEIEEGYYDICVAASVTDIKVSTTFHVEGTTTVLPYDLSVLPSYASGKITSVSEKEFATLYGAELPKEKEGEFELNDAFCQLDRSKSGLFRLVYKILKGNVEKAEATGTPDLNSLFIYNMPIRALGKMSGGMVSMEMCDDIIVMINGHFFKGFGRVIKHFFKNNKLNKQYEQKLQK